MQHVQNNDMATRKGWSSVAGLVLGGLLVGCADGAALLQRTDAGGVVTYPIKSDGGQLTSPFRPEAMKLIQETCGGPYAIVKEGETKGRIRAAGSIEAAQEIVTQRRWGIQFRCKNSAGP